MNGGAKFFATAAVLAATGCGGAQPELQIRPTPAPLSATSKPLPFRIAEGNGHLALGNVGLAIESFRKALREQPDSAEAMVGLALGYDRMNRFDLSRRYYESALAIVPADTGVLNAFAQSLQQQGRSEEAAAVRGEIQQRLAAARPKPAPAAQAIVQPQAVAQVRGPAIGRSVTVVLPPARPAAPVAAKRSVEPAAARPRPIQLAAAPPPPMPLATPRPVAALPSAPAPAVPAPEPAELKAVATPAPPAPAAPAAIARRPEPVVVTLPPAEAPLAMASQPVAVKAAEPVPEAPAVAASKPVEAKAPAPAPAPVAVTVKAEPKPAPTPATPVVAEREPVAVAAALPAPAPVTKPAEPVAAPLPPAPVMAERQPAAKPTATASSSPRLERLSPGEVALVTSGRPVWRTRVVSRSAQSTTVRFVPLRTAEVRTVKIKLLNAARYQGLAARTRRLFAQRGWRKLAIGNARRVRHTSLILYPANQRKLAERLGKQYGFAVARRASGTEVVILLGRDAARRGTVRG